MFIKRGALSTELSTGIPQKRNVFFVFVHFGDHGVTDAAISSALRAGQVADRIIVVDHGESPYKTAHLVHIVRPKGNGGYAAGLREGVLYMRRYEPSPQDMVILANNDVVCKGGAIERILGWWQQYGSNTTLAGGSFGYVSLLSGRSHIAQNITHRPVVSSLYIHGSCMVMEYGFAQRIAWPTELYMYWEDVAISMSAVQSGASLRVIPDLPIVHSDSIGPLSVKKAYYLVRNGAYLLERHFSWPWRAYWLLINSVRWAYHSMMLGHRHIAQALRDARMQKLGKVLV